MKKLLISILLATSALQAQPGYGAGSSREAASGSTWQNWTFAGVAIATATAGVLAVSLSSGKSVTGH